MLDIKHTAIKISLTSAPVTQVALDCACLAVLFKEAGTLRDARRGGSAPPHGSFLCLVVYPVCLCLIVYSLLYHHTARHTVIRRSKMLRPRGNCQVLRAEDAAAALRLHAPPVVAGARPLPVIYSNIYSNPIAFTGNCRS